MCSEDHCRILSVCDRKCNNSGMFGHFRLIILKAVRLQNIVHKMRISFSSTTFVAAVFHSDECAMSYTRDAHRNRVHSCLDGM
jgi:hypothetical protein